MTAVGVQTELARYTLPGGVERILVGQRVAGRVAISDLPASVTAASFSSSAASRARRRWRRSSRSTSPTRSLAASPRSSCRATPVPAMTARESALATFYATHHRYVARVVSGRAIRTAGDTAEDACAFAWLSLVRRDDVTLDNQGVGWVITVATHEAWRLARLATQERPVGAFSDTSIPGARPARERRVRSARSRHRARSAPRPSRTARLGQAARARRAVPPRPRLSLPRDRDDHRLQLHGGEPTADRGAQARPCMRLIPRQSGTDRMFAPMPPPFPVRRAHLDRALETRDLVALRSDGVTLSKTLAAMEALDGLPSPDARSTLLGLLRRCRCQREAKSAPFSGSEKCSSGWVRAGVAGETSSAVLRVLSGRGGVWARVRCRVRGGGSSCL